MCTYFEPFRKIMEFKIQKTSIFDEKHCKILQKTTMRAHASPCQLITNIFIRSKGVKISDICPRNRAFFLLLDQDILLTLLSNECHGAFQQKFL